MYIHEVGAATVGRGVSRLVSGLISLVIHITRARFAPRSPAAELKHVLDPNYICGNSVTSHWVLYREILNCTQQTVVRCEII